MAMIDDVLYEARLLVYKLENIKNHTPPEKEQDVILDAISDFEYFVEHWEADD